MQLTAESYLKAGYSVLPVLQTKRPAGAWKHLQKRRLDASEVSSWSLDHGIGVIAGRVSGNLEVLDFDEPGIVDEWLGVLEAMDAGLAEVVLEKAVWVTTQSGGMHVYYRSDSPVAGNLKLAEAKEPFVDTKGKRKTTRIETRGEGGYVVAPPTPGYRAIIGRFGSLLVLTGEQVKMLHDAARSFNEVDDQPDDRAMGARGLGDSVGDCFNRHGPGCLAILEAHGWQRVGKAKKNGSIEVVRPGKDPKEGASGEVFADGYFHNYSTNSGLKTRGNYYPFALVAELDHGGDYRAAARELTGLGYGPAPVAAPQAPVETKHDPEPRVGLKIDSGGEHGLMAPPPEVPCLLRTRLIETRYGTIEPAGIVERGKTAMLVGEGGAGKSFVSMQLACCVASGRPFICYDVVRPGRVLLLSAEMNATDMQRRLHYCLTASGLETEASRDRALSMIDRAPLHGEPAALVSRSGQTQLARDLAQLVAERQYALVVVDPLASFGGTDVENNETNATRDFVQYLNSLAGMAGSPTVLVVHHSNKASRGGVRTTASAARGSSALTDAVRWQWNLEAKERVEGCPEMVVLRAVKANETAKPLPVWMARSDGGTLRIATKSERESYTQKNGDEL